MIELSNLEGFAYISFIFAIGIVIGTVVGLYAADKKR